MTMSDQKLTYSQACDLLARYAVALQDRQCCGDEMQPAYMAALKACTDAMGVASPEEERRQELIEKPFVRNCSRCGVEVRASYPLTATVVYCSLVCAD
jgi:hypothetical protein